MKLDPEVVNVCTRIRQQRHKAGLTLNALADLTDSNPSYLARVERATHDVKCSTLYKLAKALNIDVRVLLED